MYISGKVSLVISCKYEIYKQIIKSITSTSIETNQSNGRIMDSLITAKQYDDLVMIDLGLKPVPERFQYSPSNFFARLFTSLGGKSRLVSSYVEKIKYRQWLRWLLIALLTVFTIVLTPAFLPKWAGFKWASPAALCKNPKDKLGLLQDKIEKMANLTEGNLFVNKSQKALECMEQDARRTWNGAANNRVLYPDQCIPANAKVPTSSRTVCVGGDKHVSCMNFIGIKFGCVEQDVPQKCERISATDPEAERRLADLKAQYTFREELESMRNDTESNRKEIKNTADERGEKILRRLVRHMDIANNIYIVYSLLAIIVGGPFVIYQRERSASCVTTLLSMKKASFMVLILIGITAYEVGRTFSTEIDFKQMYINFNRDPCYLDPEFSRNRLDLIRTTCGKIAEHQLQLNRTFDRMMDVSMDVQLCEVSSANDIAQHKNPTLVKNIMADADLFSEGQAEWFKYPGSCNATLLDEATGTPDGEESSWLKALIGSGLIAQMLLKPILSFFVTALISYIEPMTMYRGQIEIFGWDDRNYERELTEEEKKYVRLYARDSYLLNLIGGCILLVAEIALVIIAIIANKKSAGVLPADLVEALPIPETIFTCQVGQLFDGTRTILN